MQKPNRTSLSFFIIIDTEDMSFESFNNNPALRGNTQPQNAGQGMGGILGMGGGHFLKYFDRYGQLTMSGF